MLDVTFGAALLAGILSFFSPCVLPIVPPYLAYLAGVSFNELSTDDLVSDKRKRIFLSAVCFVFGFSTIFVALGASASFLGQLITTYHSTLSIIAGAVIVLMGLHFLGVFRIGFLYREARFSVEQKPAGYLGSFIMGLAFAFGWTPCVGPVLASTLFVAGAEETALKGASLLAAYSLGIGIPFLIAALFAGSFINFATKFKKHMALVEKLMGLLLVIAGVFIMTGSMSVIAQWMIDTFPSFATIG